MGTIINTLVTVTMCDHEGEDLFVEKAKTLLEETDFAWYITPHQVNGYRFLSLFPCGSKYGWETHTKWVDVKNKLELLAMTYLLDVTITNLTDDSG